MAEKGERRIGRWIEANLAPGGHLRDPGANLSRCFVLLQFAGDTLRHGHALIQRR